MSPMTSNSITTGSIIWRGLLYCGVAAAIINPRWAVAWIQAAGHTINNLFADRLYAVMAVIEQAAGR